LITGKFERQQYDNGRRDYIVDQRFTKIEEQLEKFKEEVGERFDLVETGLHGLRQEVEQRFGELKRQDVQLSILQSTSPNSPSCSASRPLPSEARRGPLSSQYQEIPQIAVTREW
jgi:hypothetical protein